MAVGDDMVMIGYPSYFLVLFLFRECMLPETILERISQHEVARRQGP